MKILALLVVVTLVWLVLASARDGRGGTAAIDGNDAWMVEQHERVVQLGQDLVIPAGHPLSRLELGDRRRPA